MNAPSTNRTTPRKSSTVPRPPRSGSRSGSPNNSFLALCPSASPSMQPASPFMSAEMQYNPRMKAMDTILHSHEKDNRFLKEARGDRRNGSLPACYCGSCVSGAVLALL